ncbi:MAG: hypothetical protein DMG34_15035 [Acidobacteria bacterium]|nr:MAG: hypothetical protein DMG34_15035 [Acidobacteriota bacterium]
MRWNRIQCAHRPGHSLDVDELDRCSESATKFLYDRRAPGDEMFVRFFRNFSLRNETIRQLSLARRQTILSTSASGAAADLHPTVFDNCPAVTASCLPPSGSTSDSAQHL